jgi:curved DNA-binding protein CbpA
MKNYYSILGVVPTAELVVIRAAYRALCQMYHPDKYEGDKHHAEALLKDFNEAWAVLSDSEKRRNYDARFKDATGAFEETATETSSPASFRAMLRETFPDLEVVAEYYPDIWDIVSSLQQVSRQLAAGFVAALLETKAFKERHELATHLTDIFFACYFGKNEEIVRFAKLLVELGARDAALELNRAVNLFGSGIDPALVINRIDQKHSVLARVEANKAAEAARKRERDLAELSKKMSRERELRE